MTKATLQTRAGRGRLRRRLRGWLSQHPAVYLPLVSHRRAFDGSRKAVGRGTELVIEGFPRCGNSFAFAAFRLAQERPVQIAHHLHAPAQVAVAVKRGLPTLVVIRSPDDAAVSLLIRAPDWTPREAYVEYIRFYTRILPCRPSFVAAPFEELTRDFGAVIRRLNRKFGTNFREFEHTPENVARCFAYLDGISSVRARDGQNLELTVARPSKERDAQKHAVRTRLRDSSLDAIRRRAKGIYAAYTGGEVQA